MAMEAVSRCFRNLWAKPNPFDKLPDEFLLPDEFVLTELIPFLTPDAAKNLSLTCKRFYHLFSRTNPFKHLPKQPHLLPPLREYFLRHSTSAEAYRDSPLSTIPYGVLKAWNHHIISSGFVGLSEEDVTNLLLSFRFALNRSGSVPLESLGLFAVRVLNSGKVSTNNPLVGRHSLNLASKTGNLDLARYAISSPYFLEAEDLHITNNFKVACCNNHWTVAIALLKSVRSNSISREDFRSVFPCLATHGTLEIAMPFLDSPLTSEHLSLKFLNYFFAAAAKNKNSSFEEYFFHPSRYETLSNNNLIQLVLCAINRDRQDVILQLLAKNLPVCRTGLAEGLKLAAQRNRPHFISPLLVFPSSCELNAHDFNQAILHAALNRNLPTLYALLKSCPKETLYIKTLATTCCCLASFNKIYDIKELINLPRFPLLSPLDLEEIFSSIPFLDRKSFKDWFLSRQVTGSHLGQILEYAAQNNLVDLLNDISNSEYFASIPPEFLERASSYAKNPLVSPTMYLDEVTNTLTRLTL